MSNNKPNICDSKLFETVYNTYAKDIRRFLFFKTQDIDKAEDLMQDAFVKLWDNCKNVNYSTVKSYIYTIANNLFLNDVKHLNVIRHHKNNAGKDVTNESPEFVMIEKEFLKKLEQTLASLPEKQKQVFMMSRIEKKKYKTIAEELNISVKAVEKRMHQALIIIRKEIGNI